MNLRIGWAWIFSLLFCAAFWILVFRLVTG